MLSITVQEAIWSLVVARRGERDAGGRSAWGQGSEAGADRGPTPGRRRGAPRVPRRRHLRLRPLLLLQGAGRRLRAQGAAGARPRGCRGDRRDRCRRDGRQARRPGRDRPEPAVPCLRLLPLRPGQSLPPHAVLRQRRDLPACPGRVLRARRRTRRPVPRHSRLHALAGRRLRRAARGLPARDRARRRGRSAAAL